jgi:hypothetical protein
LFCETTDKFMLKESLSSPMYQDSKMCSSFESRLSFRGSCPSDKEATKQLILSYAEHV